MHQTTHTILTLSVLGLATVMGVAVPAADPPPAADAPPPAAEDAYVAEAPLVPGWPAPAAPGVVNQVDLPAYRAVEGPGFFPLFMHIKVGKIPMTAPVTMPMTGQTTTNTMRFLYPTADTPAAKLGKDLKLVDVPASTILRVAHRGDINEATLTAMQQQLRDASAAKGMTVVGEATLCGYNGPNVAPAKRTWELHQVVTLAPAAAAPSP